MLSLSEGTLRSSRQIILNCVAFLAFESGMVLLLRTSLPRITKESAFVGQFPVLAVYLQAVAKLRYWTYRLSRKGEYERALRLNHIWTWVPGYGGSLEGSFLFAAGRYEDAMAFLLPRAFTRDGKPRFKSLELYTYAISLENSGRLAEAEKLLEEAVLEAPQRDSFKVSLATCLLAQEKRAGDACRLLEDAMATARDSPTYGARSDHVKRRARYAWALAANGRKSEAEQWISDVLAQVRSLKRGDEAGVHYFVGEARRMMGETSMARDEFEKAVAMAKDGNTAMNAKKGLAKLNGRSSVFSN
jgi:tetratricopeptide (TPR) repeat protein